MEPSTSSSRSTAPSSPSSASTSTATTSITLTASMPAMANVSAGDPTGTAAPAEQVAWQIAVTLVVVVAMFGAMANEYGSPDMLMMGALVVVSRGVPTPLTMPCPRPHKADERSHPHPGHMSYLALAPCSLPPSLSRSLSVPLPACLCLCLCLCRCFRLYLYLYLRLRLRRPRLRLLRLPACLPACLPLSRSLALWYGRNWCAAQALAVGIISVEEAVQGFSNTGMMTVAALLVVAEAVKTTDAIAPIRSLVLCVAACSHPTLAARAAAAAAAAPTRACHRLHLVRLCVDHA